MNTHALWHVTFPRRGGLLRLQRQSHLASELREVHQSSEQRNTFGCRDGTGWLLLPDSSQRSAQLVADRALRRSGHETRSFREICKKYRYGEAGRAASRGKTPSVRASASLRSLSL